MIKRLPLIKKLPLLLLAMPHIAQADLSLGVLGVASESIYTQTPVKKTLLPGLLYSSERVYLRYPDIGYHLIPKSRMQTLALGLSYQSAAFNPDDSNNADIKRLDDRSDSGLAFVSYRLGPFATKVAQDISGQHDGYYAQLSTAIPIFLDSWRIFPSISYRYIDKKMSNHMFGISQSESQRTGGTINEYDSPATSSMSYGVRVFYDFNEDVSLILNASYTKYNDDILKSDVVENTISRSFLTGILVSF